MTAYTERPRLRPMPDVSLTATAAFVVLALWAMGWNRQWSVAAYLVSFWHYYLYALAYYFGLVSMAVFKRDAVMMKTVALVALAFAYFQEPLDLASLCVVAAGFLLNLVAAKALGADRSYYGHEVARLPHLRVTSFPYGWIAHPMIVGNIVAFGGTLLNEDFRTRWWPLALMHVAMNLGLLLMETTVVPRRNAAAMRGFSWPTTWLFALAGGALGWIADVSGAPAPVRSAVAAAGAACAYVLFCSYTSPAFGCGEQHTLSQGAPHE